MKKKTLTVAMLQMTADGYDQEANMIKGEAFCRQARELGADIALFPEMWNVGYTFFDPGQLDGRDIWAAQAITPRANFVQHFQSLARELDMAIALTYLEKWQLAPRNSVSLIDRHGEIILTYAKVHTCDFDRESALTAGEEFYVAKLDTSAGKVMVGAMICFDREFPESARILMLQGAEIVLVPNACEMEQNRIQQLGARAFENMVAIFLTNYASPQANGGSLAFDGMAFGEDESSRDMLLVEAGEKEGIILASLDLDELRQYRKREVWGNAYRKPHTYGILTSADVYEPFVRNG